MSKVVWLITIFWYISSLNGNLTKRCPCIPEILTTFAMEYLLKWFFVLKFKIWSKTIHFYFFNFLEWWTDIQFQKPFITDTTVFCDKIWIFLNNAYTWLLFSFCVCHQASYNLSIFDFEATISMMILHFPIHHMFFCHLTKAKNPAKKGKNDNKILHNSELFYINLKYKTSTALCTCKMFQWNG